MKTAMSRHGLLALALAAALSHQTAQAQAHSSATLSNYQYTLVDLDPSDGIAPSITWGQGQLVQALGASLSDGVGWGGAPNSIASSQKNQTYAGPIDAQHSLSYQGFGVSSGPGGLVASSSVQKGGTWNQTAQFTNDFVLGANTAVTFVAQANAAFGVVVPDGSVVQRPGGYLDNGYFDWAPIQASAQAMLYIGAVPGPSLGSGSTFCNANCLALDDLDTGLRTYATIDTTKQSLLSVSLANPTKGTLASHLVAAVNVSGYATAPLAMVPEASATAQMLMGLAGVGVVVRLRRRRTS